jgi:hypothetical protein
MFKKIYTVRAGLTGTWALIHNGFKACLISQIFIPLYISKSIVVYTYGRIALLQEIQTERYNNNGSHGSYHSE